MTEHTYQELPPHVREFLENLSKEDVKDIPEGLRLARAARTMGKFWKWALITILAVFTGAAAFGQSIEWLWMKLFRGDS